MIFVTMEEELIVCQLSRTLPVQKTKQYTRNTTAQSTAEKRRGKSITIKSLENLLDLARTALAVHEDPHDHLLRRRRRKRRGLLLLLLPSSPRVLLSSTSLALSAGAAFSSCTNAHTKRSTSRSSRTSPRVRASVPRSRSHYLAHGSPSSAPLSTH